MLPRRQGSQTSKARRHFLGLAAAAGARIAAAGAAVSSLLPSTAANAMGRPLDRKDPEPCCFLRGTAIMTPSGEVDVEDLQVGDFVLTARGDARPVKWIGRQSYKQSGPACLASVMPVRISRHALDEQTPHRDLYLSPGHALFIDGVLIRAEDLVNGTSITRGLPAGRDRIEYLHIVLDSHDVVLAEGAAAETFLVQSGNHEDFENFAQFARLYPDALHPMVPVAPTVSYGGRAHLRALLRLAAGRPAPASEPGECAYERIATRAMQVAG